MTRRSPDEQQLNLFIPRAWHEWLRQRAFDERVPIAELVRQALAATYPELPPREDEGKKGAVVYPQGGSPATVCCDRQGETPQD
jgi:hypothetical protein